MENLQHLNKKMKLRIIKELTIDKSRIVFNLYQDDIMLSCHVAPEDAEVALEKVKELLDTKPVIIKEIEI